jgi:hypothetical protein
MWVLMIATMTSMQPPSMSYLPIARIASPADCYAMAAKVSKQNPNSTVSCVRESNG